MVVPAFHDAFKASNAGKLAAERTIVCTPKPWPARTSAGSLHRSPSFAAPTAAAAPKLYDDGQGSPNGLYFPKGDTGIHMVRMPNSGERALTSPIDPHHRKRTPASRRRPSPRPVRSPFSRLSRGPARRACLLSLAAASPRPASPPSSWTASASLARSTSTRPSREARPRTTLSAPSRPRGAPSLPTR